jgi:hypothetical protein
MFTLIKREIEDNYMFFIGTLLLTAFSVVMFFWMLYYSGRDEGPFVLLPFYSAILGMMIFCGMGISQMYFDKEKKISALLATLAVNRGQIFAARVITGILLILIGLVPLLAVTVTAVLTKSIEPSHSFRLLYPGVSVPVFLLGFACYCIGLQAGWTSNRLIPTLVAIGLSFILVSVIFVKGFGWEIYAILVLFIAACLICAWHTFVSAPL